MTIQDLKDFQAQTANYSGQTTTVPNGWAGQPYNVPNTCPGCGRCRDCGRPYEAPQFIPWPYPYNGPMWSGTITCEGTLPYTVNGGLGAYSAQFQ